MNWTIFYLVSQRVKSQSGRTCHIVSSSINTIQKFTTIGCITNFIITKLMWTIARRLNDFQIIHIKYSIVWRLRYYCRCISLSMDQNNKSNRYFLFERWREEGAINSNKIYTYLSCLCTCSLCAVYIDWILAWIWVNTRIFVK